MCWNTNGVNEDITQLTQFQVHDCLQKKGFFFSSDPPSCCLSLKFELIEANVWYLEFGL